MKIYQVSDPEFSQYGRIIRNYEVKELLKAMETTPLPEDVLYLPSVKELEELPVFSQMSQGIYGGMPVQMGFCNGHNRSLNALEYHRDSEINVAATDLILLLGRRQDMAEDFTLDTGIVKAFFLPKGVTAEIYADTLHYAPCQTSEEGFRCVVVLPRGTNEELEEMPVIRDGEERLLAAKNKWLLGHPEGGLPEGTWLGLKGENLTLQGM